jgi:hypothetical protein
VWGGSDAGNERIELLPLWDNATLQCGSPFVVERMALPLAKELHFRVQFTPAPHPNVVRVAQAAFDAWLLAGPAPAFFWLAHYGVIHVFRGGIHG